MSEDNREEIGSQAEINREFASKFEAIADGLVQKDSKKKPGEDEFGYCVNFLGADRDQENLIATPRIAVFKDPTPEDSDYEPEIEKAELLREFAIIDIVLDLPAGFEFPMIAIDPMNHKNLRAATTPYGNQMGHVIGADGKVYAFTNFYLFDKTGHALKGEGILNYGQPDDFVTEETSTIDFIPKEKDSSWVPLEANDYEFLGGILRQIESGVVVPGRIEYV